MKKIIGVKFQTNLLIACQILDGLLTFIGISRYGLDIEGNPIIVSLIQNFTVIGGLVLAKTLGIIIVYTTYLLHPIAYNQIRFSFIISNLLYITLAIIPWCYVLFLSQV